MTEGRRLKVREIAARIGVHYMVVYQWRQKGLHKDKLCIHKDENGVWAWESEVDKFAAQYTRKGIKPLDLGSKWVHELGDNEPLRDPRCSDQDMNDMMHLWHGSPLDEVAKSDIAGEIRRSLSDLTGIEAIVVVTRFGLIPAIQPMTLDEIAAQLGITREYVRQILCRATTKLSKNHILWEALSDFVRTPMPCEIQGNEPEGRT